MSPEGEPGAEKLEQLLGDYVERLIAHGVAAEPETLCCDHPELLEPLRECIRVYQKLDQALAPRQGLAPGRTLLHYRIVEQLGAGGMGEVYLAEDQKLGRRVALKVLPAEMANDPRRLQRFQREARAVAALSHPNIITLHSIEEAEGIHFLTMELVAGTTLSARIPPHGMPLSELFDLAIPLSGALAAAHERDITHRDLKPDNVMVDAKGRVKILDFGLAKQRHGAAADDAPTLTATLTQAGHIVGTVPYMSPEQVKGKPADARSDIFSLGVMLYQMATGRRPFLGQASAEVMSAILRDSPTSVDELRQGLPHHLGRIVRHCMEKDPEHRYQSALDVRNELADLKREVTSGEVTTGTAAAGVAHLLRGTKRGWIAAVGAAAILALAAGYFQLRSRHEIPVETAAPNAVATPTATRTRPSVAVLLFQNMNADPELDWLRGGITDMLVTDLAQSPEIEVLSTGRLYQILNSLDALERPTLSFDLIQGVAEQAAVEAVVRGSYARVGDAFRIDVTLEGTVDGAILKSDRVEGRSEEDLFAMVDELSAAVRNHFEVAAHPEMPATIEMVTTSSLEAWRLYSEASALHRQSKRREAIALLEKAVEIDPTFALALADLGKFHKNLAHILLSHEYTRRAVEQAKRLPLHQRHEIEAVYYATRWTTLGRAIEAFQQALLLDPDNGYLRNNLAMRYAELERYEEAIREYQKRIDGGASFTGNYTDIANAYAGLGRFETGYRILSDFAKRHPDDWLAQNQLGWHLTEWGKLDQALKQFERAANRRPGELFVHYGRWRTQVLREDWEQAELEATRLLALSDPFARWRGASSMARILTYRGKSQGALQRFDEAATANQDPDAFTALAHCWKAELLLVRGESHRALAAAELAQKLGRGDWPELKGLFLAALAHQQLGSPSEANRMEELLREQWAAHPNIVEERQLERLDGLLELGRGDAEAAVAALRRAESHLPPQGVEFHYHVYPDHVPIWFELGKAELAAGRPDEALRWFRQAVTSGAEHLESPVPYVRSFYFLGRLHHERGEATEARPYFERFLKLWQDGDLDRERLEETLAVVAADQRPVG